MADNHGEEDGTGGDGAIVGALVERARAGDGRAMAAIVERCSPMVRAVARRYVGEADADDVAQDVWLAFIEHLDQIKVPAATRGWLAQVTTRAAWRARKRLDRSAPTDDLGDRVVAPDDTEERGLAAVTRGEASARLGDALGELRAADRRLVLLLSADDRPDYRTISGLVGRPVGSIGPTRQRAFERLRRQPALARSWQVAS
jgi:RNA polymerase sigma factor (sigma-70 family)